MPKKVSKSIKQGHPNGVRLPGGQKQKQSQTVNIKIGGPEQKPKRAPRKPKKSISIINTGPVLSTVLSSPSGLSYMNPIYNARPTFGLVDRTIDDYRSRVNRTIAIPADFRQPIRPIDQPQAYDSLFPGPGRLLNRRPRDLDLESDISDVTDASSYGNVSMFDNNSGLPEEFRSVASQVSQSLRGLEMIEIPQRGMGSSINPPSIEEIRKTQLTPQQQTDLLYSQQFVNPTFNNNRFSSEENFRNYERGNPSTTIDRRLSRAEGFNLTPNFPIPDPGQPLFQDSVNGSFDFK